MSNDPTPLVSVVIPAYQHQEFVGAAIESVLTQSLADLELIIIDDGSTDATWDVVSSYDDARIAARRHAENRGAPRTINEGIMEARGAYVAILNSDDLFHPARLQRMVTLLERDGLDLLGTDMELIDEYGNTFSDPQHWWLEWHESLKAIYRDAGDPVAALLSGNVFIATSNFLFRRKVFAQVGSFSDYRYVHDYEFLLRCLAEPDLRVGLAAEECLLSYRLHGSNTISENPLAANQETLELLVRWVPLLLAPDPGRRGELAAAQLEKIRGHIQRLTEEQERHRLETLRGLIAEHERMIEEPPGIPGRGRIFVERAWGVVCARSVPEMARLIESRIDGVRCVSFDVFDTLLARRIDPPQAVHQRTAGIFSQLLDQRLDPTTLLQMRTEAEHNLRAQAARAGGDPECRHEEIVAAWVHRATGTTDDALTKKIRETELALETDALEAKPGVESILASLRERKIPLLAISDMYLSGDDIKHLLQTTGLARYFERIYVSADHRAGKGSGRLFAAVLKDQACKPDELLHIGDNVVSDYQVPRRLGIRSIHLREGAEFKRRSLLRRHGLLAETNSYWKGRHLLQVAYGINSRGCEPGFYYVYGREVLGPIFCTYILSLLERLERLRPERLYFVARDGFLPRELYRRLAPALGFREIRHDYVQLSRLTVAAASINAGLSHAQAVVGLHNPAQQGLLSILKVFGLDPRDFRGAALRHGFSDMAQRLTNWRDPRLLAFLADEEVQGTIRRQGAHAQDLLEGYLEGHGFFEDKKVALVDIGWNGSMQFGLEQLARWRQGKGEMWGLYFAYCASIPYQFGERSHVEGLWYDERRANPLERVTFACEEIFEEAARATHATTVGYRERRGKVVPLLKPDTASDRRREVECNGRVAELQRGVLDFADDFAAAVRLTGYRADEIRPFMLTLMERAIAFPTRQEITALTQLSHADDFGHDTMTDFSDLGAGPFNPFRPRQFIRKLRASNWRYGALAGWLRVLYRLYAGVRNA